MNKEGKRLAEIVKDTHKRLRKRYKQGEDEIQLWKDHTLHENELQKYASAMHELATTHWQANQQMNTSRVSWVYSAIKQYFYEGELQRITEKEERKMKHLNLEADYHDNTFRYKNPSKIRVLDVGSCYNPFSVYSDLEVTAIDLCPAMESVMQCDFLTLQVNTRTKHDFLGNGTDNLTPSDKLDVPQEKILAGPGSEQDFLINDTEKCRNLEENAKIHTKCTEKGIVLGENPESPHSRVFVSELEGSSFDVVIFCLLLEYIPSPNQRFQCCRKAYNLLKPNGILCIITPDSKHQNANVHIYKLWKITLAYLGFSRVKYEKKTHFHGMVFRKGLCKKAWQLDAEKEIQAIKKTHIKSKYESIDYEKVSTNVYIPQDFQEFS
ncbi:hypothetical protein SK128_017180 [Halocaridina rubra]|uniref:S-adenosylmethionine sensor upstream of mTORC1 n=1 Tax=Halocaridina rubra TaxID=373956 RepID=A0AAN8X2G6_HALRR